MLEKAPHKTRKPHKTAQAPPSVPYIFLSLPPFLRQLSRVGGPGLVPGHSTPYKAALQRPVRAYAYVRVICVIAYRFQGGGGGAGDDTAPQKREGEYGGGHHKTTTTKKTSAPLHLSPAYMKATKQFAQSAPLPSSASALSLYPTGGERGDEDC